MPSINTSTALKSARDVQQFCNNLLTWLGNGLLTPPGLAIGNPVESYSANGNVRYTINGAQYDDNSSRTSTIFQDNTASVLNWVVTGANKFGACLVEIDDGTVGSGAMCRVSNMSQSYATAAEALAHLPANDSNCPITYGAIVVQAKNATWTANTDDLTPGSDCVSVQYIDKAVKQLPAAPL